MNIQVVPRSLLVVALICAQVSTAPASTRRARIFFRQAEKAFAKHNYARALVLYRRAYAAKHLAGFYFNIGLCQRKLGHHEEAIKSFRRYLKRSKSTRNRRRAEKLLRESEAAIQAAQAPTNPKEPPVSPPPVAKPKVPPPPVKKSTAPRRRRLRPLYFWSTAALSGALLITGTVTGIVALNKSSRFRDTSTPYSELQGLKDSGQALRTTSTITFVVGAVGTAATAALFFFTDFGSKETKVAAAPTPHGAMLTFAGQF